MKILRTLIAALSLVPAAVLIEIANRMDQELTTEFMVKVFAETVDRAGMVLTEKSKGQAATGWQPNDLIPSSKLNSIPTRRWTGSGWEDVKQ